MLSRSRAEETMPPKNGMMAKLSNIKSSAQSAARKFLKAEEYPLASTGASEGLAGTDTTASGSGRQPDSAEVQCEESPSSFGQEIVHNHLPPPRRLQDRVVKFTEALTAKVIDLEKLRSLAREGVPDNDGLRALTWKLLLGYLPANTSNWMSHLMKKRAEYHNFCEELIINPGAKPSHQVETTEGQLIAIDVTDDDHPLCQGPTSAWNTYFKDAEVIEQIERDVIRTHPDMQFFSGDKEEAVRHRKEMQRALFVFAKLNPGLTYVQGMNELFAPLYYTFRTDTEDDAREAAEADSFWCFVELMTEFRDNYCKQLDNSDQGIKAALARLSKLLQKVDPELHDHLEHKTKVDTHFYAFRWITLLLTQEHSFPDTVRLWDTLLSFPEGRADFLLRVCIAMMILVREELLAGDFTHNIKLLQRYPRTTDIAEVIQDAILLRI